MYNKHMKLNIMYPYCTATFVCASQNLIENAAFQAPAEYSVSGPLKGTRG